MKSTALLALFVSAAAPFASAHPADTWEIVVESGYLWNVGNNTEIDYEIVPTQLTLRTPAVWNWWQDEAGARLVVRNRFSALFEAIAAGPETHYFGAAAAPSLEYWFPSERTSIFLSIGGGLGVTDSSGGEQGLGQDLIFNWFAQLGIRQAITPALSLTASPYFIHHSDTGLTDPNPGIDAFGFTVGCAWRF